MDKNAIIVDLEKRWNKLAVRERILVILGVIFVVVFLFYTLLLTPYNNYVKSLTADISNKSSLIQWMQNATTTITQLKTEGFEVKDIGDQSLLTIIDQSSRLNQIDRFITQLSQAGNNKVNAEFNTVPFDDLMKWINKLWRKYGIQVNKATITPTNTPGLVKAEVLFELSN